MDLEVLSLELNKAYSNYLHKENHILHYTKYSYVLLLFEMFLIENKLVEKALEGPYLATGKDYLKSKQKLEATGRSYTNILNALTYRSVYQFFEEYIHDIYYTIFILSCLFI